MAMTDGPSGSLTILMPCLDEAETVGTCVAKARTFLESSGIEGEVLVADNGAHRRSADRRFAARSSPDSLVTSLTLESGPNV